MEDHITKRYNSLPLTNANNINSLPQNQIPYEKAGPLGPASPIPSRAYAARVLHESGLVVVRSVHLIYHQVPPVHNTQARAAFPLVQAAGLDCQRRVRVADLVSASVLVGFRAGKRFTSN